MTGGTSEKSVAKRKGVAENRGRSRSLRRRPKKENVSSKKKGFKWQEKDILFHKRRFCGIQGVISMVIGGRNDRVGIPKKGIVRVKFDY